MKSRYRKKSRQYLKKRKTRRGGNKYYYEYNRNPRLFTNTTSQLGGDSRNTILPTPLANIVDTITRGKLVSEFEGSYLKPNPSVLDQPINNKM